MENYFINYEEEIKNASEYEKEKGYLLVWVDEEGLLRHVGPFTPAEKIFRIYPSVAQEQEAYTSKV